MRKPLSGKRYFYALGASYQSQGYNLHQSYVMARMIGPNISAWASTAFLSGWAGLSTK